MFRHNEIPPFQYKENDVSKEHSSQPICDSVLNIIDAVESETKNAPLNKLMEQYNKIFQQSLKDVIEKDLYDDLLALASLRNLFAHGRDLFIEFTGSWDNAQGTLDKNPLQKAAIRLYHAGIISDLNITMQNYIDFTDIFYNDDALLYFYQSAQKVEDKLGNFLDFPPESFSRYFMKLPDLEDSSVVAEHYSPLAPQLSILSIYLLCVLCILCGFFISNLIPGKE